jgi:hypothetical protein
MAARAGHTQNISAIYVPMIYTALYVKLLMRANPLQGQVGGGWAKSKKLKICIVFLPITF